MELEQVAKAREKLNRSAEDDRELDDLATQLSEIEGQFASEHIFSGTQAAERIQFIEELIAEGRADSEVITKCLRNLMEFVKDRRAGAPRDRGASRSGPHGRSNPA